MDVTVILVTYNHERFIARAIEGVLSQRTRGTFEFLISEDRSTDGTREVVDRYAAKYPNIIQVFPSERNLNSNEVTLRALRAGRGRYVAFLDGDDYWTSGDKLQRQVDFLDTRSDCAMCFHQVMRFRDDGTAPPREHVPTGQPLITGLLDVLKGHYIAGSSAMIRRGVLADIPEWYVHAPYGDLPLYVVAAQHGSIGYLPEVLGAYRLHAGGFWSSATRTQQLEGRIRCLELIAHHLGPAYRARLAPILAGQYFELGLTHEEGGSYAAALECFAASVCVRPVTRAIARRAWRIARLMTFALAGSRVTPRQTVRALTRSVSRRGSREA